MTDPLKNIISKILALDPYQVVVAELDSFSAYTTLQLPEEINTEISTLSADEQDKLYDFKEDYLRALEQDGVSCKVDLMKLYLK